MHSVRTWLTLRLTLVSENLETEKLDNHGQVCYPKRGKRLKVLAVLNRVHPIYSANVMWKSRKVFSILEVKFTE
jgi:hypothetical protein